MCDKCAAIRSGIIYCTGSNCKIKDLVVTNSSDYNQAVGIYLSGSNNTITGNTFSNRNTAGQTTTNTFALRIYSPGSYNMIHNNNFTGVTRATSPGSAYTTDGSSAATMIGSISTQGTLGTGGSMGFNLT
jgi:parallel beta-helix repeat protein